MNQTLPPLRELSPSRATGLDVDRRPANPPQSWKLGFLSELRQTAQRDHWTRALRWIAAMHVVAFSLTQWLYDPRRDSDPRLLLLWVVELACCWGVFRLVAGRWGYGAQTAPGVVMRVWITFFILVFNSVMMNVQSGWAIHWYRLAWPTLGTFGFATLAWLVSFRFLIPAVWMWLTGLVIVRFPHASYAIYGASWAITLVGISWYVDRALGQRDRA